MKIGYARVSTFEQNLELQMDALQKEGCERIYSEKVSGAKSERPELNKILEFIRKGDVLVIWKLDRLGRSLKHLVELVEKLNTIGAGLKSLNDPIDTSTSQGKLVFGIFASLAEFERAQISERTKAGLAAAKARGRLGGRPKGLTEEAQMKARFAAQIYQEGKLTVKQICEQIALSKRTLYKYLRYQGVQIDSNKTKRILNK